MRVLIVKLSSMGDLIQALPALSDAVQHIDALEFDWVVDESFAEIPAWHPAVRQVICSAHRLWRQSWYQRQTIRDLRRFWRELRSRNYDLVIDAQTNLKSALVTCLSRGQKHGPDAGSVREAGANWAYNKQHSIAKNQLAIERWRQLFAAALNYPLPASTANFGLDQIEFTVEGFNRPRSDYLVFVHNASWPSKYWPTEHWRGLLSYAQEQELQVLLPWGTSAEQHAAHTIADDYANATVLPHLSLTSLAALFKYSRGAICMDTGLAHLAAALGTKTLTLYGPTDPKLIGSTGSNSSHLIAEGFSCMPCYKRSCNYQGQTHAYAACLQSIGSNSVWDRFFAR